MKVLAFNLLLLSSLISLSTENMVTDTYLEQKTCPQLRQWCLLSYSVKRTPHPTQVSAPSSFNQWSATARPGWSDTHQENTRPRVSPTYTVRWSLKHSAFHSFYIMWERQCRDTLGLEKLQDTLETIESNGMEM